MTTKSRNHLIAADIIGVLEAWAPPTLAEEWDNCGLQVGSRKWPVKKIWVALDPLPEVVRTAAERHVDMLITHHPLLFTPLRSVDVESAVGKTIETALAAKMSIYSAHTNLDSAAGGLNHMLAEMIGLSDLTPLVAADGGSDRSVADEVVGMGRIGQLPHAMPLGELAQVVKTRFDLQAVKIVGDPQTVIRRAAVCSGAGSSLLDAFLSSDAEVYLTGDLRYHDARRVEDAGRVMIDLGHFASEHIFIDKWVAQLRQYAGREGWNVEIEACGIEKDPFGWVS